VYVGRRAGHVLYFRCSAIRRRGRSGAPPDVRLGHRRSASR
jgi:hypothetical protein